MCMSWGAACSQLPQHAALLIGVFHSAVSYPSFGFPLSALDDATLDSALLMTILAQHSGDDSGLLLKLWWRVQPWFCRDPISWQPLWYHHITQRCLETSNLFQEKTQNEWAKVPGPNHWEINSDPLHGAPKSTLCGRWSTEVHLARVVMMSSQHDMNRGFETGHSKWPFFVYFRTHSCTVMRMLARRSLFFVFFSPACLLCTLRLAIHSWWLL